MNIRDAAALLNTTPKALRRLLRKAAGFGGVGVGGIYDLTPEQIKLLKQIVVPVAEKPLPFPELDQDPGYDPALLRDMRYNRRLRAEVLARRRARQDRLAARLADPEVREFIAQTNEAKRIAEAGCWLKVDTTPWKAGVDLI